MLFNVLSQLNFKSVFQLSVIAVLLSLLYLLFQVYPVQATARIPDNLLCTGGDSLDLIVETKNFYASICSSTSGKLIYTGIDKRNAKSITLPAYAEEGTEYVADAGKYTYYLTGASLSVTQNNQTILDEDVIGSCYRTN